MKRQKSEKGLCTALCSYDGQMLCTLGRYLLEYGGFASCAAYREGAVLLDELAQGVHYDVIVLDDRAQDMDAQEFLACYRTLKLASPPALVLLSAAAFLARFGQLPPQNVDFCFVKPFCAGLLAQRVQTLYNKGNDTIRSSCMELCRSWGVRDEAASMAYLADAVAIVAGADTRLALRKEIILTVGEMHGVTVAAVDSGLRRLIDSMEAADTPAYRRFKQATALGDKRPTLRRLLYAVQEYLLRCEGKSEANDEAPRNGTVWQAEQPV